MAFSGSLRLTLSHSYTNPLDLSIPADNMRYEVTSSLTNGVSVNQADVVWHDRRTLVATSEELDLYGTLVEAFGVTVDILRVKGIVIYNRNTAGGENLTVGGAAANTFVNWVGAANDTVIVRPGGVLALWSPRFGYQVAAGTTDRLKIDSGTATVSYDVYVLGCTATTSSSSSTTCTTSTSCSTCSTLSTTSSTCSTCSTLSTTSSTCSTCSTP